MALWPVPTKSARLSIGRSRKFFSMLKEILTAEAFHRWTLSSTSVAPFGYRDRDHDEITAGRVSYLAGTWGHAPHIDGKSVREFLPSDIMRLLRALLAVPNQPISTSISTKEVRP